MELMVLGKYGPYPKAGGACSGYLVKNGRDVIVLDMGSGTLSRLLQFTAVKDITAIFISHLHFDHTSDLLPLRYLLEINKTPLTVYTAYADSEWYRVLFHHKLLKVVNITENSEIRLADTVLTFTKMKHTANDYGVTVKGERMLCYTGDTEMCAAVEACCKACDYLLADCSKPSGDTASHMTVDDAKRLAAQYPCRIIATHHAADYDPAAALDGCGIIVAEEMKTYTL